MYIIFNTRCVIKICHCLIFFWYISRKLWKLGTTTTRFINLDFIALIHPIQWTIANPVSADRPTKRQKKTSCVSTGWPVPVLCTPQMALRTSFLSRQPDVIASFSSGACTVQMCFQHLQSFKGKSVHYGGFSSLFSNISV